MKDALGYVLAGVAPFFAAFKHTRPTFPTEQARYPVVANGRGSTNGVHTAAQDLHRGLGAIPDQEQLEALEELIASHGPRSPLAPLHLHGSPRPIHHHASLRPECMTGSWTNQKGEKKNTASDANQCTQYLKLQMVKW